MTVSKKTENLNKFISCQPEWYFLYLSSRISFIAIAPKIHICNKLNEVDTDIVGHADVNALYQDSSNELMG